MGRPPRKQFSALLSFFYFVSNVVLATAAETNLWSERRKSTSTSHPTQLASLPASLNADLNTLSKPLPGPDRPLIKNLQNLIDAVSLAYGTVQEVYDSGHPQKASVLLVQDVHLNNEAQRNISGLLQELINQDQVGLVGVEGAFYPFDFRRLRAFPDKKITKDVLDAFVEKDLLSAPSYVGVTSSKEPPLFIGIDDKTHYDANLQAYLDSRNEKAKVLREIKKREDELSKEKKKSFSPGLLQFDALRAAYHDNRLGFGVYVKNLSCYGASGRLVVDQFLEAYEMEQSLNFDRIEIERRRVIEKLTQTLSEKDISNLVEKSVAYQAGRIGFGAYYQDLKHVCEHSGISLAQAPHFENYIRYVLLSDSIKAEQLFDAIEALENEISEQLAKTSEEKKLLQASEHVSLTKKLVEFSLTPKEWFKYESMVHSPWSKDHKNLKAFEDFYREADIRSEKMVEKITNYKSQNSKLKSTVLVLGGFHAPDVAALLRQKKISYATVSPKITKIEDESGSAYLSVFAREKTPLDKLFEGEKLFLSPANTHFQPGQTVERKAGAQMGLAHLLAGREIPIETGFWVDDTGRSLDLGMGLYAAVAPEKGEQIVGALPQTGVVVRRTAKVASILDPFISDLNRIPWVGKSAYFITTTIGAGLLETLGFQMFSQTILGFVWATGIFAFAHTIIEWLVGVKDPHWKRNLGIRTLLGFAFSLPFLLAPLFLLDSFTAFWISSGMHALYNALVLKGIIKGPLASILGGKNLDRVPVTNVINAYLAGGQNGFRYVVSSLFENAFNLNIDDEAKARISEILSGANETEIKNLGFSLMEIIHNGMVFVEGFSELNEDSTAAEWQKVFSEIIVQVGWDKNKNELLVSIQNPGPLKADQFSKPVLAELEKILRHLQFLIDPSQKPIDYVVPPEFKGYEVSNYGQDMLRLYGDALPETRRLVREKLEKLLNGDALDTSDAIQLIEAPFLTTKINQFRNMYFHYPGDEEISGIPGGSGLGVATVKKRLSEIGSRLEIETDPLATRFVIKIPAGLNEKKLLTAASSQIIDTNVLYQAFQDGGSTRGALVDRIALARKPAVEFLAKRNAAPGFFFDAAFTYESLGVALFEILKNAMRRSIRLGENLPENRREADRLLLDRLKVEFGRFHEGDYFFSVENNGQIDPSEFSRTALVRLKQYLEYILLSLDLGRGQVPDTDVDELKGLSLPPRVWLSGVEFEREAPQAIVVLKEKIQKLDEGKLLLMEDIEDLIFTPHFTTQLDRFRREYFEEKDDEFETDEYLWGGRGLGLWLAQREIESIGGKILVESITGKTRYVIQIPQALVKVKKPASIFYQHSNPFLRFLGRPLTVAPTWEAVFQSLTLVGVLSGWVWLVIVPIAIFTSALFAFFHPGRSPPQKRWLFIFGLILNVAIISPLLFVDPSTISTFKFAVSGILVNILVHIFHNALVLTGKTPKFMTLASMVQTNYISRRVPTEVVENLIPMGLFSTYNRMAIALFRSVGYEPRFYSDDQLNEIGWSFYEILKNAITHAQRPQDEDAMDSIHTIVVAIAYDPIKKVYVLSVQNPGVINPNDYSQKKLMELEKMLRHLQFLVDSEDNPETAGPPFEELRHLELSSQIEDLKPILRTHLAKSIAVVEEKIKTWDREGALSMQDVSELIFSMFVSSKLSLLKSSYFSWKGRTEYSMGFSGGRGVGLAMSKEYLARFGISIDLICEGGKTKFILTIPEKGTLPVPMSVISRAKDMINLWLKPQVVGAIQQTHSLASIFHNHSNSSLRFLGRPLTVAPTWEAVFQSLTLVGVLSGWVWLVIVPIAIFTSALFALFHPERSPPQRRWLFVFALILNVVTVLPLLLSNPMAVPSYDLAASGILANIFLHIGHNAFVLTGKTPNWMTVASLINGNQNLKKVPTQTIRNAFLSGDDGAAGLILDNAESRILFREKLREGQIRRNIGFSILDILKNAFSYLRLSAPIGPDTSDADLDRAIEQLDVRLGLDKEKENYLISIQNPGEINPNSFSMDNLSQLKKMLEHLKYLIEKRNGSRANPPHNELSFLELDSSAVLSDLNKAIEVLDQKIKKMQTVSLDMDDIRELIFTKYVTTRLNRFKENYFYWREKGDRSRAYTGGQGLGMAMAKDLLNDMGMDLLVESDQGATRFIIKIPKNLVELESPPSAGSMLWMRDWLFPGMETRDYAVKKAWWVENLFVFFVGAIASVALYFVTNDWVKAIQYGNALAWTLFVAGHGVDLIRKNGERAPPQNIFVAFVIATSGVIFSFLPLPPMRLSFLIVVVSTVSHFVFNRILFHRPPLFWSQPQAVDKRHQAAVILGAVPVEKYFGDKFDGFVGHVKQIENKSFVSWVSNETQAADLIGTLLHDSRARLVLGVEKGQSAIIDQLKGNPKLSVGHLIKTGRLAFVTGSPQMSVLDLLAEARTTNVFRNETNVVLNLLILEGAELPPAFFQLSKSELERLRGQAVVYYVTQMLQAIELESSLLLNWEAFRAALINA